MHNAPFILADDPDTWIKFVVFGVIGAIWLIGQALSASNKLAKKSGNRPPPFGSPPRPIDPPQPPSLLTIGRPGGPVSSGVDRGRLAQARAAAARAAQARATAARLAAMQRPAPFVQPRPAASVSRPLAPPIPLTPPRPVAPPAPFAASPLTRPAVTVAALSPHAAAALASASPRSGLLPRLTPQSLRSQFILTEILRPPIALRQEGNGEMGN